MSDGDHEDSQPERSARALLDVHLAKAISHLTLALEALDRAEVPLACGYVDLALTICVDARATRQMREK